MSQTVNIDYTAQIWQEGSQFVAHAMPLNGQIHEPEESDHDNFRRLHVLRRRGGGAEN